MEKRTEKVSISLATFYSQLCFRHTIHELWLPGRPLILSDTTRDSLVISLPGSDTQTDGIIWYPLTSTPCYTTIEQALQDLSVLMTRSMIMIILFYTSQG